MSSDGPVFKIERDKDGGYQANLYGANGELVWWTESYRERVDAVHAVELLRVHAATAPVIAGAGVAGESELVD